MEEQLKLCKAAFVETLSVKLKYEAVIRKALEDEKTLRNRSIKDIICSTPAPIETAIEAITKLVENVGDEMAQPCSPKKRQQPRVKYTTSDLKIKAIRASLLASES